MSNIQKLKQIMAVVFNIPENSVNENSSPDNIDVWDSLKHLNLVLAIEEEFDISLTEDQVVEILSYELIIEVLKEHGVDVD